MYSGAPLKRTPLGTHQIIDLLLYYSDLAVPRRLTTTAYAQYKIVAACIFIELQAAGLFPALDGTSTRTNPSSGRKYCK